VTAILQIFDCVLHASTNQELPIEAAVRIHVDVFGLPHEGHIRWITDQIQQQTTLIEVLKIVGVVAFVTWILSSSETDFSLEEVEQFWMVLSDDLSIWRNLFS
jgi:hypothetical protein